MIIGGDMKGVFSKKILCSFDSTEYSVINPVVMETVGELSSSQKLT